MIKVENIDVWGFEHAIRGMRNPLNSWNKSDSIKCYANENCQGICKNNNSGWCIGSNDLDLMKRLYNAGSEHRKYLRQIFVSMDITAPLYWWKEFDTYKIGTVSNSCSTMHKIHAKEFVLNDFSHEHLLQEGLDCLENTIKTLNEYRAFYLCCGEYASHKDKKYWWQLIQLLPSSYNQKRTITMNYENVITMIHQRSGHKLDEWNELVDIFKILPYISEITQSKLEEDKVDNNEPKVPYTAILKIK